MKLGMSIMFVNTFFTAFSQTLLKISANKPHKSWIYEYLNWRVILSYTIFVLVLVVNVYAYTMVPMKYGSIIDTFSYVFVLLFSFLLLREKVTKGRLLGNAVIILGILIYTL